MWSSVVTPIVILQEAFHFRLYFVKIALHPFERHRCASAKVLFLKIIENPSLIVPSKAICSVHRGNLS
jgi:hypothetical protein